MVSIGTINRLIRGFLARKRVKRLRIHIKAAVIIEKIFRGAHIRMHRFPHIGIRTRSHILKARRLEKCLRMNSKLKLEFMHDKLSSIQPPLPPLLRLTEKEGMNRTFFSNMINPLFKSFVANNSNYNVCSESDFVLSGAATQRREGILFPNIKFGDLRRFQRMEKAVRRIVKFWRSYRIAKIFHNLFEHRQTLHILRIQRWYLTWRRRAQVKDALLIIQPIWREKVAALLLKRNAATRIQTRIRIFLAKKFCRDLRWKKVRGIHIIQGWITLRLARRRARERIAQRRIVYEQLLAGEYLFKRSIHFMTVDFMWAGAKKTQNVDVPHELQKFLINAAQQQTTLDANRVLKIAREADLLDKVLDAKALELQFAKAKDAKSSRLTYANFLTLIENLATIKFLSVHPSEIGAASLAGTGAREPKDENEVLEDDEDENDKLDDHSRGSEDTDDENKLRPISRGNLSISDLVNSFRYARLVGKPALITKFIFTYLRPLKDFSKAVSELKAKSSEKMAEKIVFEKVQKLQRFVRHCLNMKRMVKVKNSKLMAKVAELKNRAATVIQIMIKGFLGRRFIMRMAQTLYSKYVDTESQLFYWFNPRTKASFWKKPKLLGPLDCGLPITMPDPDEQYTVQCSICEEKSSTCYCDECDEPMCGPCFGTSHRGGQRRFHVMLPFESCIMCEFQAGTKRCIQCQDSYCDCCFRTMHSKGRLRLHIYSWNCDTCAECDERAAKWCKEDPFTRALTMLCGVCYRRNFGPVDVNDYYVKRVKFEGTIVKEYRQKKHATENNKKMAAAYAARQAELASRKKYNAALLIQRVFRGWRKRRSLKDFIDSRREFFELRKKEMGIRTSIPYQVLAFWGLAPALASDTTLEKTKRLFPTYMHGIVGDCIGHNWHYACKIVNEVDAFNSKYAGRDSLSRIKAAANMQLKLALRDMKDAESVYQNAVEAHSLARKAYRNAITASKQNEKNNRKLLEAVEENLAIEKKAEEKMKSKEVALQVAQKQLQDLDPPKGLREVVAERRKQGFKMPFTVNMVHGSRLALTSWSGEGTSGDAGAIFPPQPPAQWTKMLKTGDSILINGIIFHIVSRESLITEEDDDESKGNDDNTSEDELLSSEGSEKSDESEGDDRHEEPVEWTEEHICLDRMWVLGNADGLEIYKLPAPLFYEVPIISLKNIFIESYPSQKVIAVGAITLHKVAALSTWFSTLFDEDSDSRMQLLDRANRYERYSQKVLSHSRLLVNVTSWDFTMRKRIGKNLWKLAKSGYKVGVLITKCARQYSKITIDPFTEWESSTKKVDVSVCLEMMKGKAKKETILGVMKMDLEAPCDIMRLYIYKSFRDKLNEMAVGTGFLFSSSENDKSVNLDISLEKTRYSKDFCPLVMDNKTMVSSYRCTIVKDPNMKDFTEIQEYVEGTSVPIQPTQGESKKKREMDLEAGKEEKGDKVKKTKKKGKK